MVTDVIERSEESIGELEVSFQALQNYERDGGKRKGITTEGA